MQISSSLFHLQREFFHSGQTLSVDFRKKQLRKLYKSIQKYEKQLSTALYADLGKSATESYTTEIGVVLAEISFSLKRLSQWTKPKKVKTPLSHFGSQSRIYQEPYGVCLILSPWNYPVNLALIPLIGAIAGGNTAIIKPSEHANCTSKVLKQIFDETFPKNYITMVEGDAEAASQWTNMPFDLIFFTGSPSIGRKVLEAASTNLTPCILELGGKSPAILSEKANIRMAAKRIVWAKATNAGQTCVAPDYLWVHRSIWNVFLNSLKMEIAKQYPPNPLQSCIYPKIVSEKHYQRLKSFIGNKNTVIGGGFDDEQCKIDLTVLYPVQQDEPIMKEEIFGPILPVLLYDNIHEVITFIRNRPKPLALYLFSEDRSEQQAILSHISSGSICINDALYHLGNPYLPFGGVGESGHGAYHGKESFLAFTHAKSVLFQTTLFDMPFRYYSHHNGLYWIKRLLR